MNLADTVGFIAGLFTMASNVPQVIKTYRLKSGEGLSFKMLLTLSTGLALWIVYGLMTKSAPVAVTNTAGLAVTLTLMFLKRRYDARENASAPEQKAA